MLVWWFSHSPNNIPRFDPRMMHKSLFGVASGTAPGVKKIIIIIIIILSAESNTRSCPLWQPPCEWGSSWKQLYKKQCYVCWGLAPNLAWHTFSSIFRSKDGTSDQYEGKQITLLWRVLDRHIERVPFEEGTVTITHRNLKTWMWVVLRCFLFYRNHLHNPEGTERL